ncbi:hypothetical protein, partial [uncultured Dialister sp.]|uniref:hypothetical protein n=1 Tax=uncultured Dialister sp. TaxID=278064 RepID=UPI002639E764
IVIIYSQMNYRGKLDTYGRHRRLDIILYPWYHICNFKEGNDKKSRASQMAKRAACGESSAEGAPEDGLGASGPNREARRDCPLQQQGIYGIVRRTCQVLFR